MANQKKEEKMKNKGFAIHCHCDLLIEYCYNYEERAKIIKRDKPPNEQETRLRLFKLLPEEAISELPVELSKVWIKWYKAWIKYDGIFLKWDEAWIEWDEAWRNCEKVYAEWNKIEKEGWHKKWCGCREWRNEKINF